MVKNPWKNIKMIAFDFDGVFTDNSVYINQNGVESIKCSRSDWLTAKYLKDKVYLCVISSERNDLVAFRCKKLGVDCFYGCDDKLNKLKSIALNKKIKKSEIAFVGNDINDLECLKWVGLPIVVANYYDNMIVPRGTYTTSYIGGNGAVREIIDRIIKEQGICQN